MEEIIENLRRQLRASMDREEQVHAALRSLAEAGQAYHKQQIDMMQRSIRHQSMMKSMTSILAEVCFLQGIDAETFLSHLNQRAGYYHDQSLTEMETASPGFAARFDSRADSEIHDGEMYPPMFMGEESGE
ncbi:MAG: hypothetical protein V4675_21315 [Verrucomicrobiota bacterium]